MYKLVKRIIDILLSAIALLIISPVFIICIVVLTCTGEHEIWYLQKRVGYKNKRFNIFKFITMVSNSTNLGTGSITLRNDPRVLPFGRILRKTKINELPQIFNVLNGTMSLVGPRPLMEVDFYKYAEQVQQTVYNSKPGMTGIGSIIFRDEEKYLSNPGINPIEFYINEVAPYKGALEMWYQNNASLWVDTKIVFLTAWAILFPENNLPHRLLKNLPEKPEWMMSSRESVPLYGNLKGLSVKPELINYSITEKKDCND